MTNKQVNIIELAKEVGAEPNYILLKCDELERFAALVRADLMKQVMNTCEAEYKMYDKMVEEDDAGHEEATAMIHLTRKLEKLK